MSRSKFRYLLFTLLVTLTAFQCPRKMEKINMAKIEFDYTSIDEQGLRNGQVAVDYEFCIPANEALLTQVMNIDPAVRVMKASKGRIGCTKQQWLCINSTHSKGWKNKLKAIAHLEFVEKILETHYE
jgi:hypothetical protein